MKLTESQIKEASTLWASDYDSVHDKSIAELSYYEGFKAAISQMQPEWVAINTKNDLPKGSCKAWFFDKPTQSIICGSFSPTKDEVNFILANASHYIIIQEPQPPTDK